MKQEGKNVLMITAGGVGQRFGADMPKQYCLLDGKPVIEYVIEAAKACQRADVILVVADVSYHEMLRQRYGVEVTASGDTLNQTKRNGFDYIRENYSCEYLVVAQAVQPTVTAEVIDRVFGYLEEGYDAVGCARKITDSLGSYDHWILNRERFYTINPPEGFRFPLLDRWFRPDSELTESIQQLPEDSRVKYLFDVPYFDKVTYPDDLVRIEAILQHYKK